jgi:lysophospholipase L1-like esterase
MILIFGDSITWGAWDEKGGWAQRIKNFADHKAASVNFKEYVSVYPLGISGDNTNKLLKRFDIEVEARNYRESRLVIIIAIGTNDSYCFSKDKRNSVELQQYQKNLLSLIEKSKKYNADLVFVGLTPVDERVNPAPWRPEISYRMEYVNAYNEALKNLCEKNKIFFIEVLNKFSGRNLNEFLQDGVHPNTAGHELIYNEVLTFLQKKNLI